MLTETQGEQDCYRGTKQTKSVWSLNSRRTEGSNQELGRRIKCAIGTSDNLFVDKAERGTGQRTLETPLQRALHHILLQEQDTKIYHEAKKSAIIPKTGDTRGLM